MVRKKIDNRIRLMIENAVGTRHRSMFVIVGDQGKDQVVILHHMLSKAELKARPSVLWCYKKELGFSSHPKKRMKELQKKIKTGQLNVKGDDPFDLFISSTNIRYCYYAETHKILGNTYGMCVLQDFEALTPNLLARTVETVEGGGIVVILLRTMSSLKQLFTMTMDVHSRFRTEAHQDVVGRFNERFLLSLASCENCVVVDDKLHLIPISTHALNIEAMPAKSLDEASPNETELAELKQSIQEMDVTTGKIIKLCRTLDQAQGFLKFVDSIVEKTLRSTVVMTAARGRGKSAALGLAMAAAIGFGYSNVFVTAPSPENLKTLFEFIFKGFDAMEYQEHIDYEIIQSTNPEFNKAVVRVNIFRDHRQTIQYIHPADSHKLGQAELVCIDEAAAIPLPLVKNLLGPYLVFMSSTINGYEGTGRSLSLKLVQQLRQQSTTYGGSVKEARLAANMAKKGADTSASGRVLHEIELKESIRYANGDPVEAWLNRLLCLDASSVPRSITGCPLPATCDLYYVNRDTLFSYHPASEKFLHRVMALYVSSHYKNSPNDLQLLSDAPAHHIFVLLGPVQPSQGGLPEVLCVLQVCLEGEISKSTIMNSLQRGKRASGDLIPWTVSQQYQDHDFPGLSGARVVRIATHPDYQGMGYGSRALNQLQEYFEGKFPNLKETNEENMSSESEDEIKEVAEEELDLLNEQIQPRKKLPPLLVKLTERRPESLDYLGVSFGLTSDLFRFWKKAGYIPVYMRQTSNELTGEHSCIMLKTLNTSEETRQTWLAAFWKDFRKRFVALLAYQFRAFNPATALNILQNKNLKTKEANPLSQSELLMYFTTYDIQRLELYSTNMVDYHLIVDLLPELSRLFFTERINIHLSVVQCSILLSLGLQHKTVEEIEKDIELPANQILALFNRTIRKFVQHFNEILEKEVEASIGEKKEIVMDPLKNTMDQELKEAGKEFKEQHKKDVASLIGADLSQYAIKGSECDWKDALKGAGKSIISVKSHLNQKRKLVQDAEAETKPGKKNKKKHKKMSL
ncbi:RNA cytidine acetyltransferase-like [Physella acuta]|uniref:RNA cytidine acetyltransferase-like n=1 Tax=Physella acuta TaxID=109671 RepID=UPI0027DE7CDF|nr:RNA cytidine acetyltransferase-like [Physella acuta]XP_059150894.1 RNA cytidine acetyltransferase-like [Physella acuta]